MVVRSLAVVMVEQQSAFYILPNVTGDRVWMIPSDDGWTLPSCAWTVPEGVVVMINPETFNQTLGDQIDVRVPILFAFHWRDGTSGERVRFFNLENADRDPGIAGRWMTFCDLDKLRLPALFHSVLDTWFAERLSAVRPSVIEPWCRSGWLSDVKDWVADCLQAEGMKVQGPIQQVRFWYRSAVLRVRTDGGMVYFKASPHHLNCEARLTAFLADRLPARVPDILALDTNRRWLLTREVDGHKLDEIQEPGPWQEALRDYARFQQQSLAFVDQAQMVSEWRPTSLVTELERLVGRLPILLSDYTDRLREEEIDELCSLIPEFKSLSERIESFDIPCTLEHCDANGDNFWMTDRGLVVTDWAEACVTHPFVGLVNFLSIDEDFPGIPNVKARLRDAYLEAWLDYASPGRLRELLNLILPIKRLHDAVHYSRQLEMITQRIDGWDIQPYSYAAFTLDQVRSWVPHFVRELLSHRFEGIRERE